MDILEQHLEQQDVRSPQGHHVVHSAHLQDLGQRSWNTVNAKDEGGTGIVIEEAEIVDCEGETVGEDGMRYQEALAYRVVQVNGTTTGNEIELPVTQPGNNTVQVLTSPLNGQFYVIGSANDVFTTAQTSRSLVPRTTTLQIETPRNCTTGLKKRDDRRRATHNEVERRRRDKINNWIAKLGKIIPECNATANANANGTGTGTGTGTASSGEGKANYETQSKGGILAKACEYIGELQAANQGLGQCLRDNEKLRQEITALKQIVTQLKRENLQLRSQLSSATGTNVDVGHLSP
ncbi:PREDICTED: upstream stimulatory factor 1-like isoform X1 [Dufourea novaeangliae]|uniref:upstream stimulatory factor 1-like isoform X1 n=1 Tax=Dufourea novaeangliae TaxID=178035 RepID=UPI0007678207|nr:PREDICTED: upstream stimulatory factor 1-like isoform X1 [Dufourea novaeangliae]